MADKKISELTAITGANTAADDELVIVDISADETKKISRAELATALGAGAVDSVNGETGTVVLDAADVGALALTGGTLTGDVSFGDNDKAIFGAGSDLQIYHDGLSSIVKDAGTGNLNLQTNGARLNIQGTGSGSTKTMAAFVDGGTVQLSHNGNQKFNTTATGINVTGTVTADGGTFSGVLNINASTGYGNLEMGGPSGAFIDFKSPASDDYDARLIYNGSYFIVGTGLDQPVLLQHNNSTKLNTNSTGVSVTGTLDVSTGVNIGGTNSYIYEGAANQLNFRIGADGPYAEMIDVGGGVMEFGNAGGDLALTAAGTERARLTSDGLDVTGTITADAANPEFMRITGTTDTGYAQFSFGSASSPSTTGTHMVNTASGKFQIKTGNPSAGSAQKQLEIDTDGSMDVTGELIAASYNETYDALSGTTPTVDCHEGNMFSLTTSGNTTFTFSNPPASGTAFGFTLKLVAGGTHTITYPASVDWAGGTAPDAPASGETDVLVFITHDGGTTWYGFRSGDAMA